MSAPKDIDDLIRKANARVAAMTATEYAEMIRLQRRSYVLGEIGMGSDKDEAAYRAALDAGDHPTLARLKAEAEARMEQARAILDRMETKP